MALKPRPTKDSAIEEFISGANPPAPEKPDPPKMVPLRVDVTDEQHRRIDAILGTPKTMSQHKWLQAAVREKLQRDERAIKQSR